MTDFKNTEITSRKLKFYSDASASEILGFGVIFNDQWLYGQWERDYITKFKPSIGYLELYALVAVVLTWGQEIHDSRVTVFCDNSSVVAMINSMVSTCRNCMFLLRLLTLNNLVNNRRIFALYIKSKDNDLSDALSRLQFDRFWSLAPPSMNRLPSQISELVWPPSAIWQKN